MGEYKYGWKGRAEVRPFFIRSETARRRKGGFTLAILSLALAVVAALVDQLIKRLVVVQLKPVGSMTAIPGLLDFTYLENRGAAFGLLQNQRIFFLICALVILIFAIWIYGKLPNAQRYLPLRICIIGICAGAIGNMIDRIYLGYVVDFFYFNLIDFPIFNVADIYVTVSTIVLVFLILFYYQEDEFEELFHRRK